MILHNSKNRYPSVLEIHGKQRTYYVYKKKNFFTCIFVLNVLKIQGLSIYYIYGINKYLNSFPASNFCLLRYGFHSFEITILQRQF